MTRIGLVGADQEFELKFATATGNSFLPLPMPENGDPGDLLENLTVLPPELLVIDVRPDVDEILNFTQRLSARYPYLVILLVADALEAISLRAMRAGASDLLPGNADISDIQKALNVAVQRVPRFVSETNEPTSSVAPTGRVITVVSAKGGVGKTTVATNLAVALARRMPQSTVIVDLDLQFGDVTTALGITSQSRLEEALQSAANGDTIALKSHLTSHETGLFVLPAPESPAIADTITSAQINQLLQVLVQEFRYVVVDTSSGLSDHTLGALDQTTDPLLLTTLSVPGVSGLRKVVETLSLLQMFDQRSHIVVNFADTQNGVSRQDVEQTLGVPVGTAIPTSKRAPASLNVGVPLTQSSSRDPLVKALTPMVNMLLPQNGNTPTGNRKLSRSPIAR